MKLTCLGGQGESAGPACYLLKTSCTQLLLECPLDLSALLLFLPTMCLPDYVDGHHNLKSGDAFGFSKLQRTGFGSDKRNPLQFQMNTMSPNNGQTLSSPFKVVGGHVLLDTEPWYKTSDLSLVDVSSLNAVLISNPEGMLGLPFLTRRPEFSAKIYATSPTAKIGQLMMEELVSMHAEFIEIFGHSGGASPHWLHPLTLASVSDNVRRALVGDDGVDRANWHRLYSKSDITSCMEKVHCLHYGEEVTIDDFLVIKPCSSGFDIGASNWVISGAKGSLSYVTASVVDAGHAMGLNLASFEGSDILLFSDVSTSSTEGVLDNGRADIGIPGNMKASEKKPSPKEALYDCQNITGLNSLGSEGASSSSASLIQAGISGVAGCVQPFQKSAAGVSVTGASGKLGKRGAQDTSVSVVGQSNLLHSDSRDKLTTVCEKIINAVKGGGSTLVTLRGVGAMLELLETISEQLRSSNLGHIPIFYISPAAEETLAFTNIIPEWLCASRQEKLYAGEALFGHVQLLLEKQLHCLPALHTTELVNLWQEPCVVFATHWTLRMGPAMHLLHRWRDNPLCLLIMTEAVVDIDLVLSPFKPVMMQILHYPVLQGLSLREVASTIQKLKPKSIMLPSIVKNSFQEGMKDEIDMKIISIIFYDRDNTISIPNPKEVKVDMSADLALRIEPKQLENGKAVARMRMSLQLKDGRWSLEPPTSLESYETLFPSSPSYECRWGRVEAENLLQSLRERGLYCVCVSSHEELKNLQKTQEDPDASSKFTVVVSSPSPAKVEVRGDGTFIEANDPTVRQLIAEAVRSLLHAI